MGGRLYRAHPQGWTTGGRLYRARILAIHPLASGKPGTARTATAAAAAGRTGLPPTPPAACARAAAAAAAGCARFTPGWVSGPPLPPCSAPRGLPPLLLGLLLPLLLAPSSTLRACAITSAPAALAGGSAALGQLEHLQLLPSSLLWSNASHTRAARPVRGSRQGAGDAGRAAAGAGGGDAAAAAAAAAAARAAAPGAAAAPL